jgi:hypothetical protein
MKKEIEDMKLITYPRSGQNLFRMLLGQQGHAISSSHNTADFLDKKQTITIIRNPVESVASAMAMVDFYKKENGYGIITHMLKKYEETYLWLLDNATYIISYEDLIGSPQDTVEKFLDHFSLKKSSVEYQLNLSKDDAKEGYLVSSKNLNSYPEALEYTKTALFIEDAKEIYQRLLFSKWVDGN